MTDRTNPIPVFVATRREDVPVGLVRYASVDGSVPGAAVTWDHHLTGEAINLDAMPEQIDPAGFDGVGTTMADTDAAAAAAVLLLGGAGSVPAAGLEVLRAASHRCDHLAPHPAVSAEADRLGEGLHRYLVVRLAAAPRERVSAVFERLVRELAERLAGGEPLPFEAPVEGAEAAAAEALEGAGRLWVAGAVGVADFRGRDRMAPGPVYLRHGRRFGLFIDDHPRGGLRYTVGVNPYLADAPRDLSPLLRELAAAEFRHGPPAIGPDPVPGAENWGGRPTVFGSPWNYGSRLAIDEVIALIRGREGEGG